jgi:GT2 family glycosyltransferase
MSTTHTPTISVVIVTWNRRDDVLTTVQSVYDQPYRDFEIVVVDNGSQDGSVEALHAAYPEVRLVSLGENRGASGGRNAGIAAARGKYLLFLDSDASVDSGTLGQIEAKFEADAQLGVIACKVVNAYTKQLDRVAGWIFTEKDKEDQDREFLSFSFSECGCAIRKDVFAHSGVFWDKLFFGREGEDLSVRIWDVGYTILYSPQALVYHRVSPQKRMAGAERLCSDLRNVLYIYIVRYPWWMMAWFVTMKVGIAVVRGVSKRCLPQVLRTLAEVMGEVPALWRQRRPIRDETAHRYIKLQREHGPLRWDLVTWLRYKT